MPIPQEPQSILTGAIGSLIEQRKSLVGAAHSPLVFFVLALCIIETFLICAGAFFDLPTPYKVAALGAGVVLFLVVFITVAVLVVKVPRNVVFGEESHLRFAAIEKYGTDQHNISAARLIEMTPTTAPEIPDQPATEPPPPPVLEGQQNPPEGNQ